MHHVIHMTSRRQYSGVGSLFHHGTSESGDHCALGESEVPSLLQTLGRGNFYLAQEHKCFPAKQEF
ncbi:mCG148050 [Mus musculus]|nr:mCG148050 [Mus musculus]